MLKWKKLVFFICSLFFLTTQLYHILTFAPVMIAWNAFDFLLMKSGTFFYSLVSRNCFSKITWWLIRILRDIVILLKRKWYQMMCGGLLILHFHGVIGGKFFSEIDSNEYFLIKHNFDFFFLLIFILLLNLKFWLCCKCWCHQFNVDKYKWYPGKKQS